MRPIKLIMSGIGPYAGTAPEIDFRTFEEKGLFLITGDTGSGKTTIFDAICFALYGDTTSGFKDKEGLRSDYVSPTTISYVDFYFTHQGKEYRIYRELPYEKAEKDGGKTSKESGKLVLYCNGKSIAEKPKFVNQKFKDIFDIDIHQFKQIAMIAQGEFYQLLNASTKQRTEILRTIFNTEKYVKLGDELSSRLKGVNKELDRNKVSIAQYFQDVTIEDTDDLYEQYQKLQDDKNALYLIDKMIELCESLIASDKEKLVKLFTELENANEELKKQQKLLSDAEIDNKNFAQRKELLEEKRLLEAKKEATLILRTQVEKQKKATNLVKPSYDSLQNKLAELSKTNADIEASKKQLLDIQSKVTEAEVRLKKCEESRSKLEELKKTIHDIDNEASKYDQRETLNITIGKLNAQSDELKQREVKHKEAEADLLKSIETLKLKVEGLRGKPDELNALKFNLEKLNALIGEVYAIVKDGGRYSEYRDKLKREEETEKQHQEINKEYNDICQKRSDAQEEYKHNLYGILARDLQEGKSCPVCGNKHHPEPATLARESVWTQKDIDELIAQEEAVKNNRDELLKKSTQAKAAREEYANSLKADMIKCLNSDLCSASFDDSTTMDEFMSMLTVEYNKLCDSYKEQQEKQKSLEVDSAALTEANSQLELARGEKTNQLNKDKEELEAKKITIESELAASNALVKDFEKLRYPNLEAAQKARNDAETEMSTIEESIKKATSDKQNIDKDKDNLEGIISALQKAAAEQAKAKEKLEDEFCKKLADNGFKDVEDFKVYIVTQECISKSDNDLAEYDKKVFSNDDNLKRIEKELDGKEEQDMQCLEDGLAEKKQMVDKLTEQSIKLDGIIVSNEKILGNIRDKKPRIENAIKESSMYDKLYKLISGTVQKADGVKISFEQYIQATGFDDILRAANVRLRGMTDNRYELFRRDDNQSKKFLDLMVKDYNISGKRRLVGNLSGGESFMASLSLALGLSDVVSSRAGGAFVEALFIDEGFGTLDKTTLEKTMEVLLKLANSNKLIGVISHREEMKDNIKQQIRITKTTKGSTLDIDTGF